MLARSVLAFAALGALAASAHADEVAAPTLPSLALDPQFNAQPSAPDPSLWSGLTVGSEIPVISGKGIRGGVGGGGFADYSHEFANNVVVGIQASAGYSPNLFRYSPVAGYDFASTNVEVGYDMGRLMPYLTAGVTLAKPNILGQTGFTTTSDSDQRPVRRLEPESVHHGRRRLRLCDHRQCEHGCPCVGQLGQWTMGA